MLPNNPFPGLWQAPVARLLLKIKTPVHGPRAMAGLEFLLPNGSPATAENIA